MKKQFFDKPKRKVKTKKVTQFAKTTKSGRIYDDGLLDRDYTSQCGTK